MVFGEPHPVVPKLVSENHLLLELTVQPRWRVPWRGIAVVEEIDAWHVAVPFKWVVR